MPRRLVLKHSYNFGMIGLTLLASVVLTLPLALGDLHFANLSQNKCVLSSQNLCVPVAIFRSLSFCAFAKPIMRLSLNMYIIFVSCFSHNLQNIKLIILFTALHIILFICVTVHSPPISCICKGRYYVDF